MIFKQIKEDDKYYLCVYYDGELLRKYPLTEPLTYKELLWLLHETQKECARRIEKAILYGED